MKLFESGNSCDLAVLTLGVGLFVATGAFAQNQKAQLSGLIADSSGAVVPKAKVEVLNKDTAIVRSTESNSEGYYVMPLLQPGDYSITVKAHGFQTVTRDGVKLEATENGRIDFALRVGATLQSVEVVANVSPLNQENAELKTGISPETLQELPLIVSGGPRNMAAIVTLIPGVTSPTNDSVNAHMNGGLEYEGETILDGVGIDFTEGGNGLFNLATDFPQSPDMISEVKVLTSNYEPQYGNSAAGSVILETKSGTDAFHGAVYEYLRNTALNARQFGVPNRTSDIENEYGFAIGGPVKIPKLRTAKSKPFFFVVWERYGAHGGLTRPTISIPSLQERNGDFSDWKDANGNLIPIYDPATTRMVNGQVVRNQFMGCDGKTPNVICASDPRLQNSLAKQWLQFLPSPNMPGPQNNYLVPKAPLSLYTQRHLLDMRFDEYYGDKDHIYASAYKVKYPAVKFSILPDQLSNDYYCIVCYNWIDRLNWDHTLSPALLNHFAFGYVISRGLDTNIDAPYVNDLPQIPGVPGHPYPPAILFSDGFVSFGNTGGNSNARFVNPSTIVNDLLTWVRGTHTFKFGVEHRRGSSNDRFNYNQAGNFNFARGETGLLGINSGNPIAGFLLEQVDSANTTVYGFGGTQYPRQRVWSGHFGDTWKVNPKLSINYGVRYDVRYPSLEKFNRLSFFDPLASNPGADNRLGALAFAGSGWGAASFGARYPENVFYKGVAPRLGIAYSMTPRTVLRTGYGIFYSDAKYPGWNMGIATDGFDANPVFSSTLGGLQAAFVLSQGFPQNFARPPFTTGSFLNGQNGPTYRPFQGNRLPYSQQWNLTVEHQFTDNFYVSAAYVGNKGTRLYSRTAALNALNPSLLSLGSKLYDQFGPNDTSVDGIAAPYAGWAQQLQACGPSVAQALLPYPQYCGGLIGLNENAGNSTFHSFQLKAEKRTSHGVWLLASYTNSKLITDVDSTQPDSELGLTTGTISPFERQRGKSIAGADVPQTVSVAFVYELPFGKGKRWLANLGGPVDKLVGGWEVTGAFHASSGAPFIFTSSTCNVPAQFRVACLPAVLPGAHPFAQSPGNIDATRPLFNAPAFEQPNDFNFYFGQGPRVSNLRGPSYQNQDLALVKDTQITERIKFELRAEFFNIWNWHVFESQGNVFTTNPTAFTTDVSSPSFGMWNGNVTAPRNIQVAARITF
jgi:hypothetical protein